MNSIARLLSKYEHSAYTSVNSKHLKQQILSGTLWSAVCQVIAAALRLGIMLVLARLLYADLFGLLGMSLVVMLILRDISDMGLGAALVQNETIDETDLSTVFWFNLTISLLMMLVLYFSAGYLASFLGDSRLTLVFQALSLLLPINALTLVSQSIMRRDLKFFQLSLRDVIGMLGFGVVGIPTALAQMGLWSLVAALAAQWIFRTISLLLMLPYRPQLKFDQQRLRKLLGFSLWMFASTLASRIMGNIDYFLIGRFLGASALGYYTLAFQLVIVPSQRITSLLSTILFPSFSRIQSQAKSLQNGLLITLRYLTLVLAPLSVTIFVTADIIVPLLYSSKWLSAVPIVRILSLASFFYGLDIIGSLFSAVGKPQWDVVLLGVRAGSFV